MGGFFTNAQVRVGDRPADLVRGAIINTLQTWASANEFAQSDGANEVDRTIIVGSAEDGQWIPVYDELTELQYDGILLDLCTVLSASTDSTVIGILVHDSDILDLRLFERGRPIDRYVSDPEYFGPLEQGEKPTQTGHADRWTDLLMDGVGPDHLRTIWDSQNVFAEDLLKKIAQIIGLSTKKCLVGFNSVSSQDRDSEILTRLAFRRTRPTSAEPPEIFMLLAALTQGISKDPRAQSAIAQLESHMKQFSPTDVAMALKISVQWHPAPGTEGTTP